ncbi:MAG: hypothetical protein ABSF81_16530 [Bacteroidales bacterium]
MNLDFTIKAYKRLLNTLIDQGFSFQPFEEYLIKPSKKGVILRHDVDLLPYNALRIAEIETGLNIKASYHFRIIRESNNVECIKKIADFGHEIGYHYEDLNLAAKRLTTHDSRPTKVNIEEMLFRSAYESFLENLKYFRQFYPVKIISMHGSPKSKYDSRDIWKKFNYRASGTICEPYFDIDYSKVLYLTDTGRRWNGDKFNLRDKVVAGFGSTIGNPLSEKFNFRSTSDIIQAAINNQLPDQIIINTHPQRWTDKSVPWVRELVWQNVKNVGKYFLVKLRDKGFGTRD